MKCVIDTHWHFDHTDNNASSSPPRGATILAHENTKKRMSKPHDLPVLYRAADGALAGLHFEPSPIEAFPQQTFAVSYKLQANGETLVLQHVAPAHTDSDIYVHFEKSQRLGSDGRPVLQPDVSLKIDPSTGGANERHGLPPGLSKILSLADNDTKIVGGTARSVTKRTSRNSGTCFSLHAIALTN